MKKKTYYIARQKLFPFWEFSRKDKLEKFLFSRKPEHFNVVKVVKTKSKKVVTEEVAWYETN